MTLQQLEYIVAVDKYQNFSRAAIACGVTQSTLSSLVRKLEVELDTIIFDRDSHPITTTELGRKLVEQAQRVLVSAGEIEELVYNEREQAEGSLRLGIATTISPYILPRLFHYFSKHFPAVHLQVEELPCSALETKLAAGTLDVCCMATPLRHPAFLEIPLFHEPFKVYVSPDDDLAQQVIISANALPIERMWVLQEAYCPKHSDFAFCHRAMGNASLYEAGSMDTLLRIVDANGGFTIIPEGYADLLCAEQQKCLREMDSPAPTREVSLVIHQHFVKERLLNCLAEAFKHIVPKKRMMEKILNYPIKL